MGVAAALASTSGPSRVNHYRWAALCGGSVRPVRCEEYGVEAEGGATGRPEFGADDREDAEYKEVLYCPAARSGSSTRWGWG